MECDDQNASSPFLGFRQSLLRFGDWKLGRDLKTQLDLFLVKGWSAVDNANVLPFWVSCDKKVWPLLLLSKVGSDHAMKQPLRFSHDGLFDVSTKSQL